MRQPREPRVPPGRQPGAHPPADLDLPDGVGPAEVGVQGEEAVQQVALQVRVQGRDRGQGGGGGGGTHCGE